MVAAGFLVSGGGGRDGLGLSGLFGGLRPAVLLLLFFFLFRLGYFFAIDGDDERLLFGREADLIDGGSLVFCCRCAQEMQAVANAFNLELVFFKTHMGDLDEAECIGRLGRVAVELAFLVEVQRVVEIASAEIEGLAQQLLAKLILIDGGGVLALLGGAEIERLWRCRLGNGGRRGQQCWAGLLLHGRLRIGLLRFRLLRRLRLLSRNAGGGNHRG